jgi:hypothetical protein
MRPSALPLVLLAAALSAGAAQAAETRVYERDGFILDFRDESGTTDQATADRMVETFFAVYPRLAADFNPQASRRVTFIMDPKMDGIAGAGGDVVMYSTRYFQQHPGDTDVVTHEAMHVVQAYGDQPVPGWLTEGIADYVRNRYGVDNAAGGWSLGDYSPDQKLEGGYRGAGRFLTWLEAHGHAGVVRDLDAHARAGTYTPELWRALAGKSLPELWADYAAAPAL